MPQGSKSDRYSTDGVDDDLSSDTSSGNAVEHTEEDAQQDTSDSTGSGVSAPKKEIPHRVRYDSPKAGRDNITMYLESWKMEQIDEWENLAKRTFDEKVQRTDVQNAAATAGFVNSDEEFLEQMRELGYGYFDDS